ncbi:MAG: histidinol-phosphate transaminase [Candidatus Coproplasma sp.]
MSRFANEKLNSITPYVAGEQPQDKKYIKLNTNENPYYTSQKAVDAITQDVLLGLKRYSDPECTKLTKTIADYYGVKSDNVLVTNGSDESLAFAFRAYGSNGVCFADVTYGFYRVLADFYDCPEEIIALNSDFTINPDEYLNKGKTVVIANPNAQTGIALPVADLERIISSNPDNIVIIDRAYEDFSTENVVPLVKKYDNLLVVSTFSKSRSLAGARVGYVIADEKIIEDLKKIKNSFHPYNVNTVSTLLAQNAIEDDEYFQKTVKRVVETRNSMTNKLQELGFTVLPSSSNFVLAKSDKVDGRELYLKLKERGVLVRYFNEERIKDYVRISVGTDDETEILVNEIGKIIKETV